MSDDPSALRARCDLDAIEDDESRNDGIRSVLTKAEALDLVLRLRAAEGIVREVAKYPPVLQRTLPSPVFGGSELTTIECAFCHARDAINGRVIVHAESCVYRRAVDATRRES